MEIVRNVIDTITTCCVSMCSEEDTRPGEPTERSHLLSHQQNQISPIRRISEAEDDMYPSSMPTQQMKDEQQAALNRIVQETNSNIIDVSALDTHMLEQSEYNNRVKLYSQRLAQQWNSLPSPDVRYNGLLKDVPNPEILLAFKPSSNEIETAKNFVKDAANAISDMRVDNNEDLVVPFQIT